jgi:hypothetical protein
MAQHIHANDDETRRQPDDAIALLTADHRQVRALFQQYADTPDSYLKQIIAEHVFDDIAATGLDFIFEAWHVEDEVFPPPIHMLVVDQWGEARHVRHKREGRQDAHDPCL